MYAFFLCILSFSVGAFSFGIRYHTVIKINLMRFLSSAETFDVLFRFIIFNIRLGQKKKP